VASFGTLLAAPGPCEQQNAADNMIDLAKTLNNNANMIKLAQIFAQQPRNSVRLFYIYSTTSTYRVRYTQPTSQSVPYCQSAPRNAELKGLFQCQFQGDNPKTFVGGVAVGGAGTIPFGMSAPVSPAGSCPANPAGPIPDGSQLVDITQNPGVGGATSSNGNTGGSAGTSTTTSPIVAASPAAAASSAGSSGSGGFKLANGQEAQKLNAQFATLTATSSCTSKLAFLTGSQFYLEYFLQVVPTHASVAHLLNV